MYGVQLAVQVVLALGVKVVPAETGLTGVPSGTQVQPLKALPARVGVGAVTVVTLLELVGETEPPFGAQVTL